MIIRQLGKTYKEHYIIWQKTIELTNRVFCGEWLGGSSKLQSFEKQNLWIHFLAIIVCFHLGMGGGGTNNILVNYSSCFQNNTCYWQWSLIGVRNLFSWKKFLFENKITIKFTIFLLIILIMNQWHATWCHASYLLPKHVWILTKIKNNDVTNGYLLKCK